MAKTSEPLLAAGVIVSAIDFLQRGQLLAHNAELSLWWSIAQGVAMEVSVGPVLVCSLDAKEEGDPLKAKFYAVLAGLLAFVGGAMLLLQFGSSIAGLTETQINPWVLWPLFVFRTFASIGYIALSCTKHKRFSGISPKVVITETNHAFEVAMAQFTEMHQRTNAVLEQVTQHLNKLENATQQQLQATRQDLVRQFLEAQTRLDGRFAQMEDLTEERLQKVYDGFVQEVSTVKVTLEEQSQVIKRIPERTVVTETNPSLLEVSRNQFSRVPKGATKQTSSDEFDKGSFVRSCLTESPDMTIAEIQQKASAIGQSIAGSYISEVRKAYRTEQQSE